MSSSSLIDFRRVSYTYPHAGRASQAEPALSAIDLQVREGEYLVVLGHNGSGKSTLARHCNALLTPDSGHVLVAGMDTREASLQRRIRDTVGMIFQQPDNQIIATIVEDDVAWALTVRGLPSGECPEGVWLVDAGLGDGLGTEIRVAGQEEAQNALYRQISNFIRAGRVNRLILLHGPNGSAKK